MQRKNTKTKMLIALPNIVKVGLRICSLVKRTCIGKQSSVQLWRKINSKMFRYHYCQQFLIFSGLRIQLQVTKPRIVLLNLLQKQNLLIAGTEPIVMKENGIPFLKKKKIWSSQFLVISEYQVSIWRMSHRINMVFLNNIIAKKPITGTIHSCGGK